MKQFVRPSLVLALVVLLAGILPTACSGPSAPTSINITMEDIKFTPSEWTVAAGKEITVNATNTGHLNHEFVILKKGEQVSVPFSSDDESKIYWEVQLEAGANNTAKFTAPAEPGEYQVVCGVAGHVEAGMIGKLIVK
jgi:plastocyanin